VPGNDLGFDGFDTCCKIIKASKQLIDRFACNGGQLFVRLAPNPAP